MENCVFCKIIEGKIPAEKFYEDDKYVVISDIDPVAKLHYLLIPKKHFVTMEEMTEVDLKDFAQILKRLPRITKELGFKNGYRFIINQGEDAGQSVKHMHIHLIGGQKLD